MKDFLLQQSGKLDQFSLTVLGSAVHVTDTKVMATGQKALVFKFYYLFITIS